MAFSALATETLLPAQTSLAASGEKVAAEPLIDRLVNRLGSRAVRRLIPRESHIPELAQSARSALARRALARGIAARNDAHVWNGQTKPPRPPFLFTQPEPLTVLAEIPEGPPARFTWRHVSRRVVKAEGPERIAPEWWRELVRSSGIAGALPIRPASPPSRPRDYYRIEDEDGHRYWVFREGLYQESARGTPGWFLHGVFG
jgi:protein ImuB